FRSLEQALAAAAGTRRRMGADIIDELRAVPAEKLAGELSYHHHMTVDGYVLPQTPYEAYAQGIHNEEAQLHGFNRDESAPFILFGQADLKNYEGKIRAAFEEPYASRVLALYPAATDQEARKNWADIYTAVLFTYGHYCWERQALASGIPSYVYYFTKENGRLGAWHSGEEVYLYGNIPETSGLYDAADRSLSDAMKRYYLNFIRTGDPNGEDLPLWPAGEGKNQVLEFGEEIAVTDAPYLALYGILDEMYGY
ncbi:MAG: carboxylesterase family protein, partial [Clostridia bacterium]|nr:carboxylesterase family protein [Clostridia bacterium]